MEHHLTHRHGVTTTDETHHHTRPTSIDVSGVSNSESSDNSVYQESTLVDDDEQELRRAATVGGTTVHSSPKTDRRPSRLWSIGSKKFPIILRRESLVGHDKTHKKEEVVSGFDSSDDDSDTKYKHGEKSESSSIRTSRDEVVEKEAPYHVFTTRKKWQLVYIVSLAGLFSPLSSNIYFPALGAIAEVGIPYRLCQVGQ